MTATTITPSFVDRDTIQLRFELGDIIDAVQTTDVPNATNTEDGWIWDNGWVGRIQLSGEAYMPLDEYIASPLDPLFDAPGGETANRVADVDKLGNWSVSVNGESVQIDGLSRKANILDTATVGWGVYEFRSLQNVFLDLDRELTAGDIITISFDDPAFAPVTVTYAPSEVISEAIHVNLTGFDPEDSRKIAYLSSWNGWSVTDQATVAQEYDGPRSFSVVDADSGETVLTGQTTLGTPAEQNTDFERNFSLTDVWEMDISPVTDAGQYYIQVEGVGRSNTFAIQDDVWANVFQTSFSGFYHQRSGIDLDPAYTDWTQPRSLHPDDGRVVVYASNLKLSDTDDGYDSTMPDQFEPLVAMATDEILPNAWGGWHDAGDWDRRTQHLEAVRKLTDLVEISPEWAESAAASIPENTNGLPDILDEALWGLDFFARLQTPEGGVRGGIEGDDYRGYGAASSEEVHTLYAYAPDVWTTWEFAASAAKMSRVIAAYDSDAAALWLDRAERAMDWAESRVPSDIDVTQQTSRNLAAAELYATTGDETWHSLFLDTSSHARAGASLAWNEYQFEASITYARLDPSMVDAGTAQRAFDALEAQANFLLDQGTTGGFGIIADPYAPYGWGITASQPFNATEFMVALHDLTGEDRYLEAVMGDVQYGLGANPMNMAYLTGLEDVRGPELILSADADALHGGTPPPGITLYGDYNIYDYGQHFAYDTMWNELFPNAYETPVHESFNGFYLFVPSTEYTVQQGIADMTYATGYLASQAGPVTSPPAEEPSRKMEAGSVEVQQNTRDDWTAVRFETEIEDAVVVAGPATKVGAQPGSINIRNVTDTGFEIQINEWAYLDGWHFPEQISWVAASAGQHVLADGTRISAGITTPSTGGSVELDGYSSDPLVFAQVNGASTTVPMVERLQNISADGFDFILQAEEAAWESETDAALSYIAIDGTSANSGTLEGNHRFTDMGVSSGAVILADMQTMRGNNTADLRLREGQSGQLSVQIQEEQSKDRETWHLFEEIAYWQLEAGSYEFV